MSIACLLSSTQTQAEKSGVGTIWPILKSGGANLTTYDHGRFDDIIADSFGPRKMNSGRFDFHTGVDFYATEGYRVYAVAKGEIIHVEKSKTAGDSSSNVVILEHKASDVSGIDFKFRTVYVHLRNEDNDNTGSQTNYIDALYDKWNSSDPFIEKGHPIGRVGDTGTAGVAHLHLEVLAEVDGKTLSSTKLRDYDCAVHPYRVLNYTNAQDNDTGVTAHRVGSKQIRFDFSISDKHLGFNEIEINVNDITADDIKLNFSGRNDPSNPSSPAYRYAEIMDHNGSNEWDWGQYAGNTGNSTALALYNAGEVKYDFRSNYRDYVKVKTNLFDATDDEYEFSYYYRNMQKTIGNQSTVKVVIRDADGNEIFRDNNVSID